MLLTQTMWSASISNYEPPEVSVGIHHSFLNDGLIVKHLQQGIEGKLIDLQAQVRAYYCLKEWINAIMQFKIQFPLFLLETPQNGEPGAQKGLKKKTLS